jgi:Ca-activated chloride channel family protein
MNNRTRTARPLLVALTLCLSLVSTRSTAQPPISQTQNPQTTDSPSSTPQPSVKLNLIVVDESNHAIADVRQEEVSVLEDGVPQVVTYFAKEELPVSYGIVLDNSGSVEPILKVLRATAGSLINTNQTGDETFLLRFVDSAEIRLITDFTSDRDALISGLMQMRTEGGQTAVIDAVYMAVEHAAARRKPGERRRRALVLISDGEDRASYYRKEQLIKLIRQSGVQIFVIGLTGELDKESGFIRKSPRERAVALLESIASESGGRAFFPEFKKKNVEELKAAVNEIATDLHAQYVVGYTPTNAAADDKFRKVLMKVIDAPGQPKRRVVARTGYYVPGVGSKEKDKKK